MTIQDIQDALDLPQGARRLDVALRKGPLKDINQGEFVRPPHGKYLHCGAGGFAIVYRVRAPGGKEIAFRCFKGQCPPGTAQRTIALRQHLAAIQPPLPYFVHQDFYKDALLLPGSTKLAVCVMDWVTGDTLKARVDDLVGQSDADGIRQLADQVRQMVIALQEAHVAHGDLQHDNVMVTPGGELRLVDYDSAFVPALMDEFCPIGGTAGYGHPAYVQGKVRRRSGPWMDTFAGLVVYVSLCTIALHPALYGRFSQDNIFFPVDALETPDQAPAWAAIEGIGDDELSRAAKALKELCRDAPLADRPFAECIGSARRQSASRIRVPVLPSPPPDWQPINRFPEYQWDFDSVPG